MNSISGRLVWAGLSLFAGISIGCDKANFSSPAKSGEVPSAAASDSTEVAAPSATPVTQAGGVQGGHFDLDTSIQTYAFNQGTTVRHVHEYDDVYNVTGVDYFKLLDDKFAQPQKILSPDQKFKIIVANAQLSPGARLTVNGEIFAAADWQKRSTSGDLPIYSLSGVAGTQKLSSLAFTFDPIKPISSQLVPTVTDLVRSNAPGPGQTYRAGALTIQMIDAATGQIDATLGVAKIGVPGMLWESTLFWHVDKK